MRTWQSRLRFGSGPSGRPNRDGWQAPGKTTRPPKPRDFQRFTPLATTPTLLPLGGLGRLIPLQFKFRFASSTVEDEAHTRHTPRANCFKRKLSSATSGIRSNLKFG